MTNPIALGLGLVLVAAVAADAIFYGSGHFIFLGKELFALIEWIAFWR